MHGLGVRKTDFKLDDMSSNTVSVKLDALERSHSQWIFVA